MNPVIKSNAEKIVGLYLVAKSALEGKTIQHRDIDSDVWEDASDLCFCDGPERYRIKPEPREFWLVDGKAFTKPPPIQSVQEIIYVKEIL